jgi:hypothetical protein
MSLQQTLPRFMATLICMLAFLVNTASGADPRDGSFTTSDGVRLHYIEAGPLRREPGLLEKA